jgi:hypothetical protein
VSFEVDILLSLSLVDLIRFLRPRGDKEQFTFNLEASLNDMN